MNACMWEEHEWYQSDTFIRENLLEVFWNDSFLSKLFDASNYQVGWKKSAWSNFIVVWLGRCVSISEKMKWKWCLWNFRKLREKINSVDRCEQNKPRKTKCDKTTYNENRTLKKLHKRINDSQETENLIHFEMAYWGNAYVLDEVSTHSVWNDIMHIQIRGNVDIWHQFNVLKKIHLRVALQCVQNIERGKICKHEHERHSVQCWIWMPVSNELKYQE